MKFAETLASQITPEWRTQYLRYEEMKNMLYQSLENAPVFDADGIAAGADADDREAYQTHIQQFQDQFFSFADRELTKVNTFFSEKLSEGLRKFSWLKSSVKYFQFKQQETGIASLSKSSRTLTSVAKSSGNNAAEHATINEDVESGAGSATADGVIGANRTNSNMRHQYGITDVTDELRTYNGDSRGGAMHHVESIRRRRGKIARFIPVSEEDRKRAKRYRKINDLKLAFSEFYLSLILLQNYQNLNYTAFRKIMKKHDKLFKTSLGSEWKAKNVDTAPFFTSKEIDRLVVEVENMVTIDLEGGDRQRAMKRLRVPPLAERTTTWDFFRNGFALGSFAVLLTCVIICTIAQGLPENTTWDVVIRMYRGHFFLVIFLFLSAFNVNGWANAGVNHVLIFELNPRNHLSHHNLLEIAGVLANLWCITFLGFLFSKYIFIPQYAWPLVLLGIIVIGFICPFKIFYYAARKWLLYELFRCVAAPFFMVTFADFWLADQLNSLVVVLRDLQFLICFYAVEVHWWANPASPGTCNSNLRTFGIRPLVAAFPAWIRFAQCLRRYRDTRLAFPHLLNAAKYATSFLVVLFSTLDSIDKETYGARPPSERIWFYAWILSAVVSSCFGYGWDVKMDWGFFDRRATHVAPLLREDMVYSARWFYYFAILEDFVLRFAWVISISVGEITAGFQEYLLIILGVLELVRRFIWNYFRLENEHLNNCGQFRAVRDISIAPVKRDDLQKIEDLMDMEDGMYHGRYANVEDEDEHNNSNSRHNKRSGGGRAGTVLFTKRRHTLHAFVSDNDDSHKLLSLHKSKKSSSKRSTSTPKHQKKSSASVKYAAISKTHSHSNVLQHRGGSTERHDEVDEEEDETSPHRNVETRRLNESLSSPVINDNSATTNNDALIVNVAVSPRTSDAVVGSNNNMPSLSSAAAVQQLMNASGGDMRRLNSSTVNAAADRPQFARQASKSSAASGFLAAASFAGGSQAEFAKNRKKTHGTGSKTFVQQSTVSESRSSITDEAIGQQRRSRHLTQSRVSSTSSTTTTSSSSSPHGDDEAATSGNSNKKRLSFSSNKNKMRSGTDERPLSVVGVRTEAQQREQSDAAAAIGAADAASVAAAGVRVATYADRQEKEDAAAARTATNRATDDDFDFTLSVDDAVMSDPLLSTPAADDDEKNEDVVVVFLPNTASGSSVVSSVDRTNSR